MTESWWLSRTERGELCRQQEDPEIKCLNHKEAYIGLVHCSFFQRNKGPWCRCFWRRKWTGIKFFWTVYNVLILYMYNLYNLYNQCIIHVYFRTLMVTLTVNFSYSLPAFVYFLSETADCCFLVCIVSNMCGFHNYVWSWFWSWRWWTFSLTLLGMWDDSNDIIVILFILFKRWSE